MTHEDFIKLAEEAARNAQGLRPLARHVRELYDAIRALQDEDNSFGYIAEVIHKARGDKTDALEFITRVKTYHHRDRKAAGDPRVARGMERRSQGLMASPATGGSTRPGGLPLDHPASASGAKIGPRPVPVEHPASRQIVPVAGNEAPVPVRPAGGKNEVPGELRGLTAALHNRPGRRRIVSGG